LFKTLYGLKQALRAWNSQIHDYLLSLDFDKSSLESALYVKTKGVETLAISPYVDDLLIIRNNTKLIDDFKLNMMQAFEMIDHGLMNFFLGM